MVRRRRRRKRLFSENAARAEPKDGPTRSKKQRVRSEKEPVPARGSAEAGTPSHSRASDSEQPPPPPAAGGSASVLLSISGDEFEEHYVEVEKIGEGGVGTVYSGYRIIDLLPVAIKHVRKSQIQYQAVTIDGELHRIPLEVVLMAIAAGDPVSVGKCAAVSLVAWCDLGDEILLVMERPESCMDLVDYLNAFRVTEALAVELMKQLVAAAVQMHKAGVFHRDLKLDNILIEQDAAWPVPRVRIIDFGCGCFVMSGYHSYAGTSCYKPPEFYERGAYEAGPTTVWHLGSVLLEILSSSSDFISNRLHLNRALLTRAIAELGVSNDCKNLLRSCLSFDPRRRITLEQMRRHPWFGSGLLL